MLKYYLLNVKNFIDFQEYVFRLNVLGLIKMIDL